MPRYLGSLLQRGNYCPPLLWIFGTRLLQINGLIAFRLYYNESDIMTTATRGET
jgi:hypothetical protein